MEKWEQDLARWQSAGVVDAATAERIRAFESAEQKPTGQRWQVLVALIFGGILLGAGVLLFVAAHWDEVSPLSRLGLVMGMLAVLHLGAVLAADKFQGMATALHGVGTVGAGAAIAAVGQIFNMQEHWPAAVMLWALCAAAGWWWLRDQFQQVCLLLLAPAWLISEWSYQANRFGGQQIYLSRILAVLAAVYLTSLVHSRRRAAAGILFAVGVVGVLVTTALLTAGWGNSWGAVAPVPLTLKILAIVLMALIAAVGWWSKRSSVWIVAMVFATSYVLPWLQHTVNKAQYSYEEPNLLAYVVVALESVGFAWWGMRERSQAVVNFGVVCFAVTVMAFYCSNLMDKMNRSLGLIGLGVLFLLGGWALERVRRRLVAQMSEPAEVEA
jgi:uncharacterized membrane protein